MIRLEDIGRVYHVGDSEVHALKGVDLEVPPRRVTTSKLDTRNIRFMFSIFRYSSREAGGWPSTAA